MRWRQLWRSKWPARMQPPCRSWPDWKVEYGTERRAAALGSAVARLLRAYSAQVEVFRRLRHGGQQLVRVEHVHISEGGQAIIGKCEAGYLQADWPHSQHLGPTVIAALILIASSLPLISAGGGRHLRGGDAAEYAPNGTRYGRCGRRWRAPSRGTAALFCPSC